MGSFLNTEGSGLYCLQSQLNHSCRPNAVVSFPHNSHCLTLKALKPLMPGEQIFISYLDECQLARSRHSRHKMLKWELWLMYQKLFKLLNDMQILGFNIFFYCLKFLYFIKNLFESGYIYEIKLYNLCVFYTAKFVHGTLLKTQTNKRDRFLWTHHFRKDKLD